MKTSADPVAVALRDAYVASVTRCHHRPFDTGKRGKGSVRAEGDAWAVTVLATVDPAKLPPADLLPDVVLLAEARRQLANGRRDLARNLAAHVVERLEAT